MNQTVPRNIDGKMTCPPGYVLHNGLCHHLGWLKEQETRLQTHGITFVDQDLAAMIQEIRLKLRLQPDEAFPAPPPPSPVSSLAANAGRPNPLRAEAVSPGTPPERKVVFDLLTGVSRQQYESPEQASVALSSGLGVLPEIAMSLVSQLWGRPDARIILGTPGAPISILMPEQVAGQLR